VIPHYDNAEGGHHDTRFCYLGEGRLSTMEAELPDDSFIIGVDEHTAVLLDLDLATATVLGNGGLTVRRHGRSVVHPAGRTIDFADLASGADRSATSASSAPVERAEPESEPAANVSTSLRAAADAIADRFDAALATNDVDGCVTAILDLEQTLVDWSSDTLTSDEGDHARAHLHRMVVRLGELATVGAQDPRTVVGPFVDGLLELRGRARDAKDFATSDWIREHLTSVGVEVRDTPDGAEWLLR